MSCSSNASPTEIQGPIGDGADEPVFNAASNTVIYQDDMNAYTTATAMGAGPQGTTPRIAPIPSPVANSRAVDTHANQVISPGRDGTGKALRMSMDAITAPTQGGSTFYTLNTPTTPDLTTHYFTYWARISFAGQLKNPLAIKWFEAWHRGGDRIQWNTHDHLPCPGNSRADTYWQIYDKGVETNCQGNQPIGPYFENLIDAKWHRYTYSYRPNTSTRSRDGFARMWIDGVKIIDVSAATIGVTPPGGEKPWCDAKDVDTLAVSDGIVYLFFGSTQTTSSPAWTYDIDDLKWWR